MINSVNTPDKNKADDNNGLNDWNKRLDENLEPSNHNDVLADEKAKEYSEQFEDKKPK
ncbi:hypothetical protein [Pedobacter sp. Leaf132]|uniref:hypothetical protein n=1 Tax=Pedobacter sp. Leaf132 TaxID=2876557 RepID=UPI001E630589|nr:hypothetical protein [Pedobacter sp. Leaf132]